MKWELTPLFSTWGGLGWDSSDLPRATGPVNPCACLLPGRNAARKVQEGTYFLGSLHPGGIGRLQCSHAGPVWEGDAKGLRDKIHFLLVGNSHHHPLDSTDAQLSPWFCVCVCVCVCVRVHVCVCVCV